MPTVPTRFVIGTLVTTIGLIVAAVTLSITYTVSLTTIHDVGNRLSISLVSHAKMAVESSYDKPAAFIELATHRMRAPNEFALPTDFPADGSWRFPWIRVLLTFVIQTNNSYGLTVIVFDDGSGMTVHPIPGQHDLVMIYTNDIRSPTTNYYVDFYWWNNMTFDPRLSAQGLLPGQNIRGDNRLPLYLQTRSQVQLSHPLGLWGPPQLFVPSAQEFILANIAVKAIYNGSNQYLGVLAASPDISKISSLLENIKPAPETEVFMISNTGQIYAATSDAPYLTITETTSTINPPGCGTNEDTKFADDTLFRFCLSFAREYPYSPLKTALGEFPDLLSPSDVPEARKFSDSTTGENFYVVATTIQNAFANFQFAVVFFMPESLILGNLVQGRNIAILITAGIFVTAAILSLILVFILLRPLDNISQKMVETANLRSRADEEIDYSLLTEVRQLQRSYRDMNAAIASFTRYVPKDVVVDLMSTGQLCEIKMVEMRCTMLFTDIQGFTTICERVPVEQLSSLISTYFEVMSKIVMRFDGIIDKFIGDCIMAVWGAPFPTPSQEVKSTLCALLLNRETLINPLKFAFDDAGEVLGIRTGLHTGLVLAGNMGSLERMSYTVIGDGVNLAARLESLNKQFGTRIMISEDTRDGLGTSIFTLRTLLKIAVVGKSQPVKVFEVMGIANSTLCEKDRLMLETQESTMREQAGLSPALTDDDAASVASYRSAATHEAPDEEGDNKTKKKKTRFRLTRRPLTKVIFELCQLSEASILSTEAEKDFASLAEVSVEAYFAKDFARCLATLDKLSSKFPSLVGGGRSQSNQSDGEQPTDTVSGGLAIEDAETETAAESRTSTNNSSTSKLVSGSRENVSAERSLEVLRVLCEGALQDPTSFREYLSATDK